MTRDEPETGATVAVGADSAETAVNGIPLMTSTVDVVASVVAGVTMIGQARDALRKAGWTATIAANRITVNDEVVAHLVPALVSGSNSPGASWFVGSVTGKSMIRIVRAGRLV